MAITILVPATLRSYCHEATSELVMSAPTVRAALEQLEHSHPMLYRSICDETGAIRRHVNLFVNDALLHNHGGLEAALKPGDVLSIMPAVSGG